MAERPDDGGQRPVALVTGAARRVGRATARALAAAGCDVVITWRSSEDEAKFARAELAALGASVETLRLDLDDLEQTDRLGAELAGRLGRLDYLVHNASIYDRTPLESLAATDILRHYRVNAAGPLLLTARLAPLLRQAAPSGTDLRAVSSKGPTGGDTARRAVPPGGGAIVCMCDIHAMGRPRRDFVGYSMSKAALEEMVRSLARELAPEVRVNGVAPGVVAWPEEGPESHADEQRKYLSRVPLGRAGTPEDAAEVVRWLAMEATYLTGVVVPVDGGRRLA